MGVPLVVAAVFAAGCGLYKKYSNEKEIEEQNRTPGDSYRLPPCCIEALKSSSNNGNLAASIGAFVATASLVGTALPGKPSATSVGKTAKAGWDAGSLVMMNWSNEAALQTDFAQGIATVSARSMFYVVHEHYLRHAREDSDANKFWTKLYELKKKRLSNVDRATQEAYDSIDK